MVQVRFVSGHAFRHAASASATTRLQALDSKFEFHHRLLGCEGAETRQQVKDQLEALILQMYKSNILYSEAVREFKKRFIMTVLEENRGNQCKAARQLSMHRNTLSRTMQELKIDARPLRAGAKRPPRSAHPVTLERKQAR
jgi:DNA-binding NtrC family response regulator